ncbi:DNA integrity scanning diadenylate cyclase DisA [Mariniluteicoccus endophyticus]
MPVRRYRAQLAPGTPLRSGLERILRGRTGALIVMGTNRQVQGITTGGFTIDVPFTATALRELAKMDGAIILDNDCERILMAGVHLVPDPSLETIETGTRHRTAHRVAQQCGVPVVTVSASMNTIQIFLGDQRYLIEQSPAILARANLALQTLERYQVRLTEMTSRLNTLEVHDQVTVRDFVVVSQRLEMVRRLAAETEAYATELGSDGRLLQLQLFEVQVGFADLPELLENDYRPEGDDSFSLAPLRDLPDEELVDPVLVARAIGFTEALDARITPRGLRQLSTINRLPGTVAARLIDHFGSLQALFGASTQELQEVDGVGGGRARMVREGLTRLAEAAYVDRVD